MSTQTGSLAETHTGSIRQRRNNQTGQTVWDFFLTVPDPDFDPKRTIWFEFELGQDWPDMDDGTLMAACIRKKKNIAVRFQALKDALSFMEQLYEAAGIKEGAGPVS